MNPTQQRLDNCRQSFSYYRKYHLANRHPAFIPWHSQAYALLFDATGDPIFRDFVFEMNDWLLPIQQWDRLRSLDLRGRFYDATYPEYGLSQAAATGNYLPALALESDAKTKVLRASFL
ncbi:hypothetical protein [Microseira wollei]|uniref:Uncharacterized protein n=1 Tax=Microseira wollei NIES-4236 TaxID=2530354 RepID=A0AAV3XFX4_9CYAN|nr:hypothetical protein [Microseira wollei]GET40336.1 hypothetical protein MiSe_51450 [Microseira wollei NIES-4236]